MYLKFVWTHRTAPDPYPFNAGEGVPSPPPHPTPTLLFPGSHLTNQKISLACPLCLRLSVSNHLLFHPSPAPTVVSVPRLPPDINCHHLSSQIQLPFCFLAYPDSSECESQGLFHRLSTFRSSVWRTVGKEVTVLSVMTSHPSVGCDFSSVSASFRTLTDFMTSFLGICPEHLTGKNTGRFLQK